MIRRLLIIVIAGLIVSVVCFTILGRLGGLDWRMGHHHHHGELTAEETRDLPWTGTEALHIDNSAAVVTYVQGPTPKFTVSGPKSRIDALVLTGDTLSGPDFHWHFSDDEDDTIQITVTGPNTHSFFLSGAEKLTLTNYDQDTLDLNVSGAAHVKAVGHAKRADVDMSGAGRLDFAAMPVDDLKVDISGAGSATVDPKQSADIAISGAGHVKLLTRPAKLTTHISGIGAITTPEGRIRANRRGDED